MWDPIDPVLFEQTLRYVQTNFHIIPLDEALFHPRPVSSKPLAAITFDDGYHDFIDYAIPLLDKYKMSATMYVVSDCIDRNLPTWTYLLDTIFADTKKTFWENFHFFDLPEEYHSIQWGSVEERIMYCKKLKQYLKKVPAQRRDAIVQHILLNFDDVEIPAGMMMTWEEVRQIHSAGFDIGSHSVSHPTLATIEDETLISFELTASANRIREKTGNAPSTFSYPIGSYDERVKRLTEKAGYKAGMAVNGKLYNPDKQDIFEVPRIELYNESWLKTSMRTSGMISYFK